MKSSLPTPVRFLLVALMFGAPMAVLFTLQRGPEIGIPVGLVSGLVFSAIMLVVQKKTQQAMSSQNASPDLWEPGESVLHEGLANHREGFVSNGGMLSLTSKRLRFRGHSLNVSQYDRSWPIESIQSVETCMTMFIIPNGLRITLKDGSREQFVVNGNHTWMTTLQPRLAA